MTLLIKPAKDCKSTIIPSASMFLVILIPYKIGFLHIGEFQAPCSGMFSEYFRK